MGKDISNRLQASPFGISIRTWLLLAFVAVSSIPLIFLGYLVTAKAERLMSERISQEITVEVKTAASSIDLYFTGARRDVLSLARILQRRMKAHMTEAEMRRVEHEFIQAMEVEQAYYQARFINARGMEIIRVNNEDGQLRLVPQGGLQYKGDRYYFKDAMVTPPGAVYFSPLDLNVEYGRLEVPHRLVLRVATVVQDDSGRVAGVVIINIFGEKILGALARLDHSLSSRVLLVDGAGFFAEMVEVKGGTRFRAGTSEELGNLRSIGVLPPDGKTEVAVRTMGDIIVAQAPVRPRSGTAWTLIKIYSRQILLAEIVTLRRAIFSVTLPLVIFAVGIAVIVAKIFHRADARIKESEDLRRNERLMISQGRQAAMGELTSSIAHQWRQPLNVLGLVIQQMTYYYDSGVLNHEMMSENTAKAMELIQYMSKTIDDFMGFFRPDTEAVNFVVNEVITRTISLFEKNFKYEKIDIVIDAKEDLKITGYPNGYGQALLNILMNARDALIEKNIPDGRITVCVFAEGGKAVVTITDNAGGIAEGIIEKVFDPYFTTKGPDKGTGVGLYMSKAIIEKNMGGRLTVRNTKAGAEFKIEICG